MVFEWWHKEHDLTLYISDLEVEYVKAWGVNIHSEMEEGCIDSIQYVFGFVEMVDKLILCRKKIP